MPNFIDLTGCTYGRLTVLKFSRVNNRRQSYWICRCECGSEIEVAGYNLRNGNTTSCGCYSREQTLARNIKHGHHIDHNKSSEYITWLAMKNRCSNPNYEHYADYGGRGIKICERWLHSFENFLEDMGLKPSSEYSIERKDSNGNYEPGNCVWATRFEQARNKRIAKNNTSGVKGVCWIVRANKWVARINVARKRIDLGSFDTIEEAIKARKQAEEKYWEKSSN